MTFTAPVRRVAGLALAAIVLASWPLGGCASQTSDRSLVHVDVAEALRLVEGSGGVLGLGARPGAFVDPRTSADFRAGHIAGAIHLPLERVRDDHARLDGYGALVVYGDTYGSHIAAAMSKALIELGHDDVHTLRGGLDAWRASGREVQEGRSR